MKVLFKNTTKYDKENRDNFVTFHNKKYGKKEMTNRILITICIVYMIICNIIFKNWFLLIGVILACVLIYLIAEQQREKKKEKQKNKEFTFFFYERYIKIKYKRQFERIYYFEIKKIFETQDNFFLYTDEKHSLILDKDGFSIGTAKEFSKIIKKKCIFKYSDKTDK